MINIENHPVLGKWAATFGVLIFLAILITHVTVNSRIASAAELDAKQQKQAELSIAKQQEEATKAELAVVKTNVKKDTETVTTTEINTPNDIMTIKENGKDKKVRVGFNIDDWAHLEQPKIHLVCKSNGDIIIDKVVNNTVINSSTSYINTLDNGKRIEIYSIGNMNCVETDMEIYLDDDQTELNK